MKPTTITKSEKGRKNRNELQDRKRSTGIWSRKQRILEEHHRKKGADREEKHAQDQEKRRMPRENPNRTKRPRSRRNKMKHTRRSIDWRTCERR